MTNFGITREKDDNDLLKQLKAQYCWRIDQSSRSLHVLDINASFTTVENIYSTNRHRLKNGSAIKDKLDEFKRDYNALMLEGDEKKNNWKFFYELNEKIKTIYALLEEGLNTK